MNIQINTLPNTVVFVADDYFYKWTAYKSQIERKKIKNKIIHRFTQN